MNELSTGDSRESHRLSAETQEVTRPEDVKDTTKDIAEPAQLSEQGEATSKELARVALSPLAFAVSVHPDRAPAARSGEVAVADETSSDVDADERALEVIFDDSSHDMVVPGDEQLEPVTPQTVAAEVIALPPAHLPSDNGDEPATKTGGEVAAIDRGETYTDPPKTDKKSADEVVDASFVDLTDVAQDDNQNTATDQPDVAQENRDSDGDVIKAVVGGVTDGPEEVAELITDPDPDSASDKEQSTAKGDAGAAKQQTKTRLFRLREKLSRRSDATTGGQDRSKAGRGERREKGERREPPRTRREHVRPQADGVPNRSGGGGSRERRRRRIEKIIKIVKTVKATAEVVGSLTDLTLGKVIRAMRAQARVERVKSKYFWQIPKNMWRYNVYVKIGRQKRMYTVKALTADVAKSKGVRQLSREIYLKRWSRRG